MTQNKSQKMLEGLSAVENSDENSIVGYLTWYSVGDDLYNREDLRQALMLNGIDGKYLPNEIRGADAFRRATKAIETKRHREEETKEEYKNYIIRDVVSNGTKLQRNIVIETVNQKGERLQYNPEGAKLHYNKEHEQFTFVANDTMAEELAEEAQCLFEKYRSHHNGASVRASVVHYLHTLSPTPVRPSGGVYFVPKKHTEQLRHLVNFVSGLPRGESHMIPLINSDDNRLMIKDKVKDNLDKIIDSCRLALSDSHSLQKTQVKTIVEDARRIVTQFKDYRELLNDTIGDLESSVELVRQSITEILRKGDA